MQEWYEKECRPFDLYETEDGWYYQAVGTEDNLEEVRACQIIEALNKDIKGIRIRYGKITDNLNIWGCFAL